MPSSAALWVLLASAQSCWHMYPLATNKQLTIWKLSSFWLAAAESLMLLQVRAQVGQGAKPACGVSSVPALSLGAAGHRQEQAWRSRWHRLQESIPADNTSSPEGQQSP